MSKTLCVVPMPIKEANEFVANFHRHNKPVAGARFAIGASAADGLQGVAIVGRPVARVYDDGFTSEVNRLCVLDSAPKGICSFLYARCWKIWRAMGGKRILTYTLQDESGASLRGAGWNVYAELAPNPKGWQYTGQEREWQPVYGQAKLRWGLGFND